MAPLPLLLFSALLFQAPAAGQVPTTPNYTVRRAAGPIVVDGRLDDAGWTGAADIPLDWEVSPGDNTPAKARAVCHVTFDPTHLYLGCHAFDPRPEQIRAHVSDRDNVYAMVGDDLIGDYIDPFNDQRRNFSTRTMARAIVQYRDVNRNPLEYQGPVGPRDRGLTGQFRWPTG